MSDLKIAKHTQKLDELLTQGLAANERAYVDAMARIASLAEAGVAPEESTLGRRSQDAPTGGIAVQAA